MDAGQYVDLDSKGFLYKGKERRVGVWADWAASSYVINVLTTEVQPTLHE